MRKRKYTLLVDSALSERLKAVKHRMGVPEAEQIRRGIALWLETMDWPAGRRRGERDDTIRQK
jgi:hypothetical protein